MIGELKQELIKRNNLITGKNIAIVGGGIVGLAIAYKLSFKNKVVVFEKEKIQGFHQSGRNSGVLHCGLSYTPGSLKAELSVKGIREMIDFAKKNEIDHDICGKVVVATNQKEATELEKLAVKGKKNGLKGLRYLTNQELKLREPYVVAKKALLVPEEGIIDYKAVMNSLVNLIKQNSGEVVLNFEVNKITEHKNKIQIQGNNDYEFDKLIACGGLWSDKLFSKSTYEKSPLKIIPFRGEYLKFKEEFNEVINHLVYPVPDSNFPFLGVHFTRMIDGSKEVGPNAVLALKRDGYSNTSFSLNDTLNSLSYPGLLRFISKNFMFSINEFKSSFFKSSFIAKAQKMIPDVNSKMLERGPAGIRAQAVSINGDLLMDFNIEKTGNQIHVLNAPSPGATSALAIASHIIDNYV